MKIAIYPGSFDPITNGHLDVICRAAKIFDKVIVGVLINPDKKGLFKVDERVELIKRVVNNLDNIEVKSFQGLLVDFMRKEECKTLIKGLRGVNDFDYEFQMALLNKKLDKDIETLFMMTNSDYACVSSSAIKQIGKFGGSVQGLIPDEIIKDFNYKLNVAWGKENE